jgi:hypothetical protein
MTTEINSNEEKKLEKKWGNNNAAASAPVYGLGLIGALVYFLQHATTFWMVLLGFVKAIFWPGILVYELLKFLGM